MANERFTGEFWKESREAIRVPLGDFKGPIASSRVWLRAEDGSWRPSEAVIAFHIRLLPRLADELGKAVNEARRHGLIPISSDEQ
jgi:hypothetical protein